jgi:hypothetical protein
VRATSSATLRARLERAWRTLGEILYGLTGYEFALHALHRRAEVENLLLALLFGDMLGLPILPPYYSLRLLPYVVPQIAAWKRRVLRERSPLESEEFDLIEM